MHLHINPGDPDPIAEQIRSQVADAIAGLELRPGDRLVPPADLAQRLVTSPRTVMRAYRALEAQGFCRRGASGFEVAPATVEQRRERSRQSQIRGGRESLLEELELARQIQRQLMPPASVESGALVVAARAHAARFVSGDFYEVIERDEETVDVVVADVSGKGVGASLIMMFVKAMLSTLEGSLSVAESLRRLNDRLCDDLVSRQFVAMAYARVSGASGRFELANAGLPYPLWIRAGGRAEPVTVSGPSLPLGIRPNLAYESVESVLVPGDRMLLYSDGIPEAPFRTGEPLGYTRLTELVEAGSARSRLSHAGESAQQEALAWLDALLARVSDVADGEWMDDQTALVVERRTEP